jgi:hypothetical protein
MTIFKFFLAGLTFTLLLLPPAARADVTTTLTPLKDNTIFQNQVNNSAGGAAGIFSGTSIANSPRRGLIAFDIRRSGSNPNGVPASSMITSVSLSMYIANQPPANSTQTIGLRKMLLDWGENPSDTSSPAVAGTGNGVPAAAGDATWNANFFGTSNWPAAGATGSFSASSSSSATVSSSSIDIQVLWSSTPALIADVQSWLDNPANNFGWALINNDEVTTQTMKAFYSRQATLKNGGVSGSPPIDPFMLPVLTVTYVPEPTTITLLIASALLPLAFSRQRR